MNQIQKYEPLPPALQQALLEEKVDLRVGDLFIRVTSNDCSVVRIVGFEQDDEHAECWYVRFQIAGDWETTMWGNGHNGKINDDRFEHDYQTDSIEDFKKYYTQGEGHQLERGRTIQEYFAEAAGVINGKVSMDVYRPANHIGEVSEDRALMHKGSKEMLTAMQQNLETLREKAATMATFVKYEMERRRRELNSIKNQLYEIVAVFEKKIERIMRVITTIELYLGIEEELFQLQDGPRARDTDIISFRQQVLYMDEEAGKWEKGGLDDDDIKWFDNWLVTDNNFKKLLPEAKGMVVLQPRRKEKYYSDDWFLNAMKNGKNLGKTYLLIRNGECLYRIFTEKIVIQPRLFPKRTELEEMMQRLQKEVKGYGHSEYRRKEAEEKIDDMLFHYKHRAALMQGLIDRAEVFAPMAEKISIYKLDECKLVQFIYDDEVALPSGRLPFWDWVIQINSKITRGSRVLITGVYDAYKGYYKRSDFFERFYNRQREGNTPDSPRQGLYVVEEFASSSIMKMRKESWKTLQAKHPDGIEDQYKFRLLKKHIEHYRWGKVEGETELAPYQGDRDMYEVLYTKLQQDLTIKYNPKDTVYHAWEDYRSNERKYNIRFRIETSDTFLLNYDQIDLDDVNFYLNSRVDRYNYLNMMPILEKVRQQRLKEIANEKEFIRFVVGRVTPQLDSKGEALRRTMECVRWWKYKNQWKRSIASDDTLALRMIEKRLLSPNYHTFKHHNNRE